ncbi:MAG: hypothetical protein ACKOZT_14405 [Cyanobium sp.]
MAISWLAACSGVSSPKTSWLSVPRARSIRPCRPRTMAAMVRLLPACSTAATSTRSTWELCSGTCTKRFTGRVLCVPTVMLRCTSGFVE